MPGGYYSSSWVVSKYDIGAIEGKIIIDMAVTTGEEVSQLSSYGAVIVLHFIVSESRAGEFHITIITIILLSSPSI